MKQLIGLLMAMVLPAMVQAQFAYTINKGAITITHYTGTGGMVTIPSTINGLPVIAIGVQAFFATRVSQVLIPDSVISIGNDAFSNCESLTNVTLGSGVKSIGDSAFAFCSKLNRVNCRGNAPSLVKASGSAGPNVFRGTLATVYYLSGTTGWGKTLGGRPTVLWNPPVPFTCTTNNSTITITGYTGSGGAVTIPDSINFLPVTSVGPAFFSVLNMTSVTIPNGVTNIGNYAFYQCISLTNVMIGSNVIIIGTNSFYDCYRLPSVIIPNSVITIQSGAFSACIGLTNLIIPRGVMNIESNAFGDCRGLSNLTIPGNVTSIGIAAFVGCTGLTNLTMLDGVRSIGGDAFNYCFNLASVAMPNSVTNIGIRAFADCTSLTGITVPNGITSIEVSVFDSCFSLTSVTIPNSVMWIGGAAFSGCFSLTNVTIPSDVTAIYSGAFSDCPNLNGVFFKGNAPSLLGLDIFFESPNVTVYYLPDTTGWDDFSNQTGIPVVLWLPEMQTTDANFGVQNNQFGFNINWASGQTVVVEACTNFSNPVWQPVQTNTLTSGSSYFSDPQWANYPARFYRLRSP